MTSLRNEGYVSWEIGKQLLLQPSKNVKENDWLPRKNLFVFYLFWTGIVRRRFNVKQQLQFSQLHYTGRMSYCE